MPHNLYGKTVGDIAFGMLGLGLANGGPLPDEQAFAAIKAAIDAGCNYFNGAEFYGPPGNNSLALLRRYFEKYPADADKIVLNVKGGLVGPNRIPRGDGPSITASLEACMEELGPVGRINVFGPARKDPDVDYARDTLGAVGEFVAAGRIDGVGCSEISASSIREAARTAKIDVVEVELSLFHTDPITDGTLEACHELGILVAAYSPLGGGLLGRRFTSPQDLNQNDYRTHFPRFQGDNFAKNMELVRAVEELAAKKGCTASQIAISWVLSLSRRPGMPRIMVIQGSTDPARIRANTAVVDLTDDDLREIEQILTKFAVAGERYPAVMMEYVNL